MLVNYSGGYYDSQFLTDTVFHTNKKQNSTFLADMRWTEVSDWARFSSIYLITYLITVNKNLA
jgi:hypothetical protein